MKNVGKVLNFILRYDSDSIVDVYIHYFGKPYIIPAGKTVLLEKDC